MHLIRASVPDLPLCRAWACLCTGDFEWPQRRRCSPCRRPPSVRPAAPAPSVEGLGGRGAGLWLAYFSRSGSSTTLIMEEQGFVLPTSSCAVLEPTTDTTGCRSSADGSRLFGLQNPKPSVWATQLTVQLFRQLQLWLLASESWNFNAVLLFHCLVLKPTFHFCGTFRCSSSQGGRQSSRRFACVDLQLSHRNSEVGL